MAETLEMTGKKASKKVQKRLAYHKNL